MLLSLLLGRLAGLGGDHARRAILLRLVLQLDDLADAVHGILVAEQLGVNSRDILLGAQQVLEEHVNPITFISKRRIMKKAWSYGVALT